MRTIRRCSLTETYIYTALFRALRIYIFIYFSERPPRLCPYKIHGKLVIQLGFSETYICNPDNAYTKSFLAMVSLARTFATRLLVDNKTCTVFVYRGHT